MSIFARTERLIGADGLARLNATRVILFGTGGVGSWCAEALVRSGIGHLTIVDPDCVDVTNVNRQLPATTVTIGQPKVEVLQKRLLEINPSADFGLAQYDIVIDAIDSLTDKMNLLLEASATPAEVFCSLGAACKIDPTKIKVAEFFSVRGCPLGSALRKKMRQNKTLPQKPILAVYDEEVLPNLGPEQDPGPGKAVANGTFAHITGIFGFTLAGLVIEHILKTE